MTTPWLPLFARDSAEGAAVYDALLSGVPAWLQPSLFEWIRDQIRGAGTSADAERIRAMERLLRVDFGWNGYSTNDGIRAVLGQAALNEGLALQIVDFLLLVVGARQGTPPAAGRLENVLAQARSEWTIGRDSEQRLGLVRRVPEGVNTAARETAKAADTAGRLLAKAWEEAYGLRADPSDAYRQAVRSVEAAAVPVVLPNDKDATLGKVIGTLRSASQQWTFVYPSNDKVDPYEVMVGMLQSLWTSQYDRHVTEGKPLSVTQEEAEAAVALAVTLVQWFHSGHVKKAE